MRSRPTDNPNSSTTRAPFPTKHVPICQPSKYRIIVRISIIQTAGDTVKLHVMPLLNISYTTDNRNVVDCSMAS
jgi:hypothetical protein